MSTTTARAAPTCGKRAERMRPTTTARGAGPYPLSGAPLDDAEALAGLADLPSRSSRLSPLHIPGRV